MTLSPPAPRLAAPEARALLSLEEAARSVLSRCARLAPRRVATSAAAQLVLAEQIVACEGVPAFANSAMDGYALRAGDASAPPVRLEVVEAVMAGEVPSGELRAGQAARIMTGAPLPAGADAVCPFEQAREEGPGVIVVEQPLHAGANVRSPGEDVAAGEVVFAPGELLGPAALGVLASLGVAEVLAHPLPVVGVASTGDELVEGPSFRPPGKIRDANRPALLAALSAAGFPTRDLGIVPDDVGALTTALAAAATSCDAVVVSAGVSAGDRDLVGAALRRLCGGDLDELAVALRPGKPLAVGRLGSGPPVIGLPGNPVAAMVGLELLVLPALRQMAGRAVLRAPLLAATTDVEIARRADGRVHVVPAQAVLDEEGRLHVVALGARGSHQLRSLALANVLAVLADGEGLRAGDALRVLVRGDVPPAATVRG